MQYISEDLSILLLCLVVTLRNGSENSAIVEIDLIHGSGKSSVSEGCCDFHGHILYFLEVLDVHDAVLQKRVGDELPDEGRELERVVDGGV